MKPKAPQKYPGRFGRSSDRNYIPELVFVGGINATDGSLYDFTNVAPIYAPGVDCTCPFRQSDGSEGTYLAHGSSVGKLTLILQLSERS
jgi:hypothetical protein